MSTTITPAAHGTQSASNQSASHQSVDPAVAACSCRVYDAECALHAAHQSGVDEWITAAGDTLHQALVDYLAAVAHTDGTVQ